MEPHEVLHRDILLLWYHITDCASCLSGKNRLRFKCLLQDTSDQRAALTSCYNNKYKQHKNINRLEVFTPTGTPAESIWAIN